LQFICRKKALGAKKNDKSVFFNEEAKFIFLHLKTYSGPCWMIDTFSS